LYSLLHRLKPSLEIMGVHVLKSTIVAIEDSISTETNMDSIYASIEKIKDTLKDVVVELEVEREILTNELAFHKKELQV